MNGTRRTIGIGAFILLVVLGTGWAFERASSGARTHGGAAVSEPVKWGDGVSAPSTTAPKDESTGPADTIGSSPAYDRSDLVLTQG